MAPRPVLPSCRLRARDMPASFRHLDGHFSNERGQTLSYVALFPARDCPLRGLVLYLHGLGDHSRRYFHLYERLCTLGFGVFAYDLLSHGQSDSDDHGIRAHSANFDHFVTDTNAFMALAKAQLCPQLGLLTDPKWILAGMSYGTLVGLHAILSGTHDFQGLVLVAPALLAEMTVTLKVQAFFARPLSKLLPKARIVPAVNGDYICRDPKFLDDFKADPLTVTEPMTARMGAETLKAMKALEVDERVEDECSALCKLPVLMMMGSKDKVTSLELAQVFYKRLAARDKEFKVFDGYYHSLFDDPEQEAVFEYLDNWLKTKFPLPEGTDTTIGEEETDEIKADVTKDETKVEAADTTTTVKKEDKERESVMQVTGETFDAGSTCLMTEETKVEVVQTSAVRKEEHETEVMETTVAAFTEAKAEVADPIASLTDETKVEVVAPVKTEAELLETVVVAPEDLKVDLSSQH